MIDVRAQFPLDPGYPRLAMDWDRVDAIVIHHTAVDPRSPEDVALPLPAAEMAPEDELNHIRVIHLYHKSKGFGGIGYHLIVFPSGRVYYVATLRRWGAHVAGWNDKKLSVALAGDFRSISPATPQFQGAWEAVDFIKETVDRPDLILSPHRFLAGTTCPGMAWPLPLKEEEMLIENEADFIRQLRKHLPDVLPGLIRANPAFAAAIYRDIGARQVDTDHKDSSHGGDRYTDAEAVKAVKEALPS